MELLANLSIICGILSLLCLLALHFLSPEFEPNWRMVSEYALGKYKSLVALFFFLWGISSLLIALVLWNVAENGWTLTGAILVAISGIGAVMGGLFDVKHKLHGPAFLLGIPTLLIGSLLVGYSVSKMYGWETNSNLILLSSHAIWISCVLMGACMALLFSGFKKAGVPFGKDIEPPQHLPEGVIGLVGYANRLVVFCYIGWNIIIACSFLNS